MTGRKEKEREGGREGGREGAGTGGSCTNGVIWSTLIDRHIGEVKVGRKGQGKRTRTCEGKGEHKSGRVSCFVLRRNRDLSGKERDTFEAHRGDSRSQNPKRPQSIKPGLAYNHCHSSIPISPSSWCARRLLRCRRERVCGVTKSGKHELCKTDS